MIYANIAGYIAAALGGIVLGALYGRRVAADAASLLSSIETRLAAVEHAVSGSATVASAQNAAATEHHASAIEKLAGRDLDANYISSYSGGWQSNCDRCTGGTKGIALGRRGQLRCATTAGFHSDRDRGCGSRGPHRPDSLFGTVRHRKHAGGTCGSV